VKAQDLEGELRQHLLDDAEQVCLGDRLHAGHYLPLRDAVHRVDVIQPLDAVQVPLVHAVDADEAGPALGCRRLAHADLGVLAGLGLGQQDALVAVARAVAQVVQVAHRDRAQPSESLIAEDIALAAQHAGRGRARQRAHGAVHIDQQRHVRGRVQAGKRATGRAVVLDQRLAGIPARDQPRDLGSAVAAQALQVRQHGAAVGARQPGVVKALENGLDPGIAVRVASRRLELHHLRARQHLTHLLQRAHLGFVHVDHHRFDDRRAPSAGCLPATQSTTSGGPQAHSSVESRAWLQAHTSLDKTPPCVLTKRRAIVKGSAFRERQQAQAPPRATREAEQNHRALDSGLKNMSESWSSLITGRRRKWRSLCEVL